MAGVNFNCVCCSQEILQFNVDYKQMKKEIAMNDLRCKIEHFKEQYEGLSRRSEPHLSYMKVVNGGEDITVHNLSGQLQTKILYYISNFRAQPRTLYFSRVCIFTKVLSRRPPRITQFNPIIWYFSQF